MLEGLVQLLYVTEPQALDHGISDLPLDFGGIPVSCFDLFAAAVAAVLVFALIVFFNATRTGPTLRAVSDDHHAALAVGLRLRRHRPAG